MFTENMFNPVLTILNIKSSIQLHCYKSSLELHYVVSNVISGQGAHFFKVNKVHVQHSIYKKTDI